MIPNFTREIIYQSWLVYSQDVDEHGKLGGEREIPWHCIIKEEALNTDEWHKCMWRSYELSKTNVFVFFLLFI